MDRCPVCIIGTLKVSGSHMYCNKCTFSTFTMTQDYIDVCAKVVGLLISNTQFESMPKFHLHIDQLVEAHLPKLHLFMDSITTGYSIFMVSFTDVAIAHAVNVTIGPSFNCSCGSTTYEEPELQAAQRLAYCGECGAPYIMDETRNTFVRVSQ